MTILPAALSNVVTTPDRPEDETGPPHSRREFLKSGHGRQKQALRCALCLAAILSWSGILSSAPLAADRSQPPKLGTPPALRAFDIQHLKLANGMPVLLVEKHQVPVVEVVLQIETGTVKDPAGKNGLANLTMAMLREGAGRLNALELADEVEFLGATLSSAAGLHTSQVLLHVPVARVEPALKLMADIVQRPTFPAEELERQRRQRLTSLAQAHDQPTAISATAFVQSLFGREHPYGRMTRGDERTLRSFTVEDCRSFYRQEVIPGKSTLIVVGDVKGNEFLSQLEKAFGQWNGPSGNEPSAWPAAAQVTERSVVLIDKPGAAQSVIRIGRLGPPRLTEDYYTLTVLNTVLGGSFSSRLNQNLREKHGYAYGASSRFDFRPQPGPFVAAASVQTDVTDKALAEFMNELRGIMGEITEAEVERAKNYITLSYPSEFQTTAQIAGQLGELVEYNLPDSYLRDFTRRILGVTKADVEAAAKKYLDPDRVAIVIVGDREKIESGVKQLNLGSLQLRTIEQVLGPVPKVPKTAGAGPSDD